jgi:hypothetical protein
MKCLNENGLRKLIEVLENKVPGIKNVISTDGNKLKIVGSLDAYVVIPGQPVIEAVVVPQPGEAPTAPGDLTKAALEEDPESVKSSTAAAAKIPAMQQQYNTLFNATNAKNQAEIQALKSQIKQQSAAPGQPGQTQGTTQRRPVTPEQKKALQQQKPGQQGVQPLPPPKPQGPTPEELAAKRQAAAAKSAAATIKAAGNTQITTPSDVYESIARGFKA